MTVESTGAQLVQPKGNFWERSIVPTAGAIYGGKAPALQKVAEEVKDRTCELRDGRGSCLPLGWTLVLTLFEPGLFHLHLKLAPISLQAFIGL